jgi:broad specificity phosphatase PhoE
MATIYLIRHGQAQFGFEDYDALSPLGIEQSKHLGKSLKERNIKIDKIISGNMKRHLQTAEHTLNGLCEDKDIVTCSDWNEFDHRDILAKYDTRYSDINQLKSDIIMSPNPKLKIQEVLTGAVSRWTNGQTDDYNETWEIFCRRIEKGLADIAANSGKQENVFVFTSGGSISVILRKVLGLSIEKTFELQLVTANASITRIKTPSRGYQLLSFNDHAHFEGENKNWLTFR